MSSRLTTDKAHEELLVGYLTDRMMAEAPVHTYGRDDLRIEIGGSQGALVETGWSHLMGQAPVILVGNTGAGKTSALDGLSVLGVAHDRLPGRRELTDWCILPATRGGDTNPVTDRHERFRLTSAFRDLYPGGMAEILSWISLPDTRANHPLVFDGLRGANELGFAVDNFPAARFFVIRVTLVTRLFRLCTRQDPFDGPQLSASEAPPEALAREYRDRLGAAGLLERMSAQELQHFIAAVATARIDPGDVEARGRIVMEEALKYDADEAAALLRRRAADRTVIVDSAKMDADAVAGRLAGLMASISPSAGKG